MPGRIYPIQPFNLLEKGIPAVFEILLKSMGLTPEKIKELSDGIVDGLKTLNLNVANILTKMESVETRLASLEAKLTEKENTNV